MTARTSAHSTSSSQQDEGLQTVQGRRAPRRAAKEAAPPRPPPHLRWPVSDVRRDIFKLSKILGHASVAITQQVYAHLHPDAFAEDCSRVAIAMPRNAGVVLKLQP
jgi:integrase